MHAVFSRFFNATHIAPDMRKPLFPVNSIDNVLQVHISRVFAKVLVALQKAWIQAEETLECPVMPKEISFSCEEYGVEIYDTLLGEWIAAPGLEADPEIVVSPAFITVRGFNEDYFWDLDPESLEEIAYGTEKEQNNA